MIQSCPLLIRESLCHQSRTQIILRGLAQKIPGLGEGVKGVIRGVGGRDGELRGGRGWGVRGEGREGGRDGE